MATKRMIAWCVINTDSFCELSNDAKCLYFYLNLQADDYGFTNNIQLTLRQLGITNSILDELSDKKFIIQFDSGAIVITHWFVHNTLKNDRIKVTMYNNEYSQIIVNRSKIYEISNANMIKNNPVYTSGLVNDARIQNGSKMETQYSIAYDKEDNNSLDKDVDLECNATCNVTSSDEFGASEKEKKHIDRIVKHGLYSNVELTNSQYFEFMDKEELVNQLSTMILHGYKSCDHYADLLGMINTEKKQRRLSRTSPFKRRMMQ